VWPAACSSSWACVSRSLSRDRIIREWTRV
jgi:hypothetical protein